MTRDAVTPHSTKRLRRIRRDIRRMERHRDWILDRLGLEHDSGMLMELREALRDVSQTSAPPREGIVWQESRLPPPDGPADCFSCRGVVGSPVPIRIQRAFELGLRRNPTLSNLDVWKKLGLDKDPAARKMGHGQVAIYRMPHAEHAQDYKGPARP
jgi:hypothetical protein